MSAVEDRIVGMKFDNKQFEPAAKQTLGTLDKLKQALNFSGSNKGLNDLQSTANRFSLNGLSNAAGNVSAKFSAMSAVAFSAINNIVTRAVDAGVRIAKAFTLDPLKQGFEEYETQLGSVQTILANTQASGAKLKDVNRTLDELNAYSDKTIYNFAEMARNIGTFTAAGVDLKTSTASIKGIANLAALSGSNSQQASTAMYQLSQAISAGRVSLQDWNSVVNAGMGGTVFQRALAQTAERMGTLDKGAVKLSGKMKNATINGKSFRESITAKPGEESWLTSKVLTETLKQFTGDMTDAELAAMGFSKAQIKSIQEQAKTAQNAATQVKTFTQLIGTLQESSGSGWAQTFEILVGDFEEAKKLWTEVNNILGGFIGKSADARNKMLQDWKDLGGRTKALEGVQNIFKALVQVVTPIGKAFREIFPRTTGKQLYDMTLMFVRFTENLKMGDSTLDKVKRTAKGFFAIFSIGVSIVKGILGVLGELFEYVGSNSGGFLNTTAEIGDFLVALDETIKKGDLVTKFFEGLRQVISSPISSLEKLSKALGDFFSNINPFALGDVVKSFGRLRDRLEPLDKLANKVAKSWDDLHRVFRKVSEFLDPMIDQISKAFQGIGDALAKAFEAGDFNNVYDAINTGLLAGIVLLIKKFIDNGLKIDFNSGFADGIKETFGALTSTLEAMQTQIQAKTLMLIASAIAILTASVVALSLIDSDKLTKALTAMGVGFGQLLLAMAILTKISGTAGFIKVPMIAGAMILLSTAVLILTAAVKNLSSLSWEELGKGLTGVAAILAMLIGASFGLDKAAGSMTRAGFAMIPLAIGINIMAGAVKKFATLSWRDMAKGLVGLAGSLLIIAGAMRLMPANMGLQAASLVLLSIALNGIGLALRSMGGMKWSEIAKALVALAGSLAILAGAMYLMTGALPGAAALVVAAGAMMLLAPALILMGTMSWGMIAKGMVALAGSLLILAGGLTLMSGSIAGSAALLVAAAALNVLVPVLAALGVMSWSMIIKGLVAIAGAFAVLGLAGLLLTPVIPSILALGAALLLLGASMALVGTGALALATAFSIFAAAGGAGVTTLMNMMNLIPQFMIKFAEGIGGFAVTLAAQSGKFVAAFASLLGSLADAIIMILPKLGQLITTLIHTLGDILIRNGPYLVRMGILLITQLLAAMGDKIGLIVAMGTRLIVNFLRGIGDKQAALVRAGADVIIKFMDAISREIPRLADAGARATIRLINGIANAIRRNKNDMANAGRNLGSAILEGMVAGIRANVSWVADWARYAAQRALNAAKNFLGINSPSKEFMKVGKWSVEGMAYGLKNNTGIVESASKKVAGTSLDTIRSAMNDISSMDAKIDMNPTITPILDLDQITRGVSEMNSMMMDQKTISADIAYRQAVGISNERNAAEENALNAEGNGNTYVNLTQNNTSPKELSAEEIYRNTKSQLAMMKESVTRK